MNAKSFLIIGLTLMWVLVGCVSKEDYNEKVKALGEATESIAKFEKQIKEKDSKIAELEESKEKMETKVLELQLEIKGAQQKTDQLAEEIKVKSELLEKSQGKLVTFGKDLANFENLLSDRESKIALLESRVADLIGDIDKFRNLADIGIKKLDEFESLANNLRTENSSIQSQLIAKNERLNQLHGLLEEKNFNLTQMQQMIGLSKTNQRELRLDERGG